MQTLASETIVGLWYGILAHFLVVSVRLLWNKFRRPSLTLLVIPYPKPKGATRRTPRTSPGERPQVVELRVKISSEKNTHTKVVAARVKQGPGKRRGAIGDGPPVCPNCGYTKN